MNILSIETSTFICGVSFINNGVCNSVFDENCPRASAEILPDMVTKVKNESGFSWSDLDGIAISIGPGSFTGLRIGLSFSKGLAFSHDIPLVPVPTLSAMAMGVKSGNSSFRIALFSHRDLFYTQKFKDSGELFSGVGDPTLVDEKKLLSDIKHEKNAVFICGGEHIISRNETISISPISPSAKWTGLLAHRDWKELIVKDPSKLVPNYIAPFEITKRKNAIS